MLAKYLLLVSIPDEVVYITWHLESHGQADLAAYRSQDFLLHISHRFGMLSNLDHHTAQTLTPGYACSR